VRDEIGARDNAIANLQNKLSGVTLELEARDVAIAKLKTELTAGENKQLNFFPPEPTPTPTPEPVTEPEIVNPESTPEPKTKPKAKAKAKAKAKTKTNPFPEGSFSTNELVAHINQNFPDDGIVFNSINDCLTLKNGKPKSNKLSDYKAKYGFEFLGKFSGQRRFKLV
jgi:hypothetical protein